MKILLIAGHGGTPYDPGAVGNGYTEAVETRRMANAVAPLLRTYGFEAELYDQSEDAYKIVTQGGSLPLSGVSYVLEFHLNAAANDAAGNGVTTGSEIWVHTNEQGVTVEQAILRRIAALGFKNRGVKRSSSLAVLKHVFKRGISHALIETCFIDDRDDMELYGREFDAIARAIADGVAEGFGKAVTDTVKEDDEMVEQKRIHIDGKDYSCEVIEKEGHNYVKLASLTQAGYNVTYDAETKNPGIAAPQTRAEVPDGDSAVQAAIDKVQAVCGLEEQTMAYLRRYQYGDDLLRKLADAMN